MILRLIMRNPNMLVGFFGGAMPPTPPRGGVSNKSILQASPPLTDLTWGHVIEPSALVGRRSVVILKITVQTRWRTAHWRWRHCQFAASCGCVLVTGCKAEVGW